MPAPAEGLRASLGRDPGLGDRPQGQGGDHKHPPAAHTSLRARQACQAPPGLALACSCCPRAARAPQALYREGGMGVGIIWISFTVAAGLPQALGNQGQLSMGESCGQLASEGCPAGQ